MKRAKYIHLIRHAVTAAIGDHETLLEEGLFQIGKICHIVNAQMFALKTGKIHVFTSGTKSAVLTAQIIAATLGVSITPVTDLSLSVEPGTRKSLEEILANIAEQAADDEIVIIVGHHDQIAEMPKVLATGLLEGSIELPVFEQKHVMHGAFFQFNLEARKCLLIQPTFRAC